MPERKGFTVYLTSWQRGQLDQIGNKKDLRPGQLARRYIRDGIRQHLERLKRKKQGQTERAPCLQG